MPASFQWKRRRLVCRLLRTAAVVLGLATAPFRAIPVCAGITYTMGGIAIDRDCRAQHRDGGAIAGLYAAGSSTGGFEGGPNAAYIGGLSKAIVTGMRAAESIAGKTT